MKDLKVDRHMKHLKLQRERSMKSYNSPTAIANRTLRKSLEWGGSMGDIAAIVYTDKLDTNDKPIRERGAKEYEVSLKSGGGKKIVKTHFDHRKHQWKQQIGIKEYKEAMQRRGHNKLMMSPDYIRVFGVQPNMGWSIDRRRQGRGRDSTSKRLFG